MAKDNRPTKEEERERKKKKIDRYLCIKDCRKEKLFDVAGWLLWGCRPRDPLVLNWVTLWPPALGKEIHFDPVHLCWKEK